MKPVPALTFGAVSLRTDGDMAVVSLRSVPELAIRIPIKRVEQWLLRRLRDETMRPEKTK